MIRQPAAPTAKQNAAAARAGPALQATEREQARNPRPRRPAGVGFDLGAVSILPPPQEPPPELPSATWLEIGAEGTRGTGGPLPYAAQIQRAFGRHDIREVRAHSSAEADAARVELGAEAFAAGEHIAVAVGASLFTVAHEAAHVIQQRRGIRPEEAIIGGRHELLADAVADAVVAGRSAEALLGPIAPPRAVMNAPPAVQRRPASGGGARPPLQTEQALRDALAQLRRGRSEGRKRRIAEEIAQTPTRLLRQALTEQDRSEVNNHLSDEAKRAFNQKLTAAESEERELSRLVDKAVQAEHASLAEFAPSGAPREAAPKLASAKPIALDELTAKLRELGALDRSQNEARDAICAAVYAALDGMPPAAITALAQRVFNVSPDGRALFNELVIDLGKRFTRAHPVAIRSVLTAALERSPDYLDSLFASRTGVKIDIVRELLPPAVPEQVDALPQSEAAAHARFLSAIAVGPRGLKPFLDLQQYTLPVLQRFLKRLSIPDRDGFIAGGGGQWRDLAFARLTQDQRGSAATLLAKSEQIQKLREAIRAQLLDPSLPTNRPGVEPTPADQEAANRPGGGPPARLRRLLRLAITLGDREWVLRELIERGPRVPPEALSALADNDADPAFEERRRGYGVGAYVAAVLTLDLGDDEYKLPPTPLEPLLAQINALSGIDLGEPRRGSSANLVSATWNKKGGQARVEVPRLELRSLNFVAGQSKVQLGASTIDRLVAVASNLGNDRGGASPSIEVKAGRVELGDLRVITPTFALSIESIVIEPPGGAAAGGVAARYVALAPLPPGLVAPNAAWLISLVKHYDSIIGALVALLKAAGPGADGAASAEIPGRIILTGVETSKGIGADEVRIEKVTYVRSEEVRIDARSIEATGVHGDHAADFLRIKGLAGNVGRLDLLSLLDPSRYADLARSAAGSIGQITTGAGGSGLQAGAAVGIASVEGRGLIIRGGIIDQDKLDQDIRGLVRRSLALRAAIEAARAKAPRGDGRAQLARIEDLGARLDAVDLQIATLLAKAGAVMRYHQLLARPSLEPAQREELALLDRVLREPIRIGGVDLTTVLVSADVRPAAPGSAEPIADRLGEIRTTVKVARVSGLPGEWLLPILEGYRASLEQRERSGTLADDDRARKARIDGLFAQFAFGARLVQETEQRLAAASTERPVDTAKVHALSEAFLAARDALSQVAANVTVDVRDIDVAAGGLGAALQPGNEDNRLREGITTRAPSGQLIRTATLSETLDGEELPLATLSGLTGAVRVARDDSGKLTVEWTDVGFRDLKLPEFHLRTDGDRAFDTAGEVGIDSLSTSGTLTRDATGNLAIDIAQLRIERLYATGLSVSVEGVTVALPAAQAVVISEIVADGTSIALPKDDAASLDLLFSAGVSEPQARILVGKALERGKKQLSIGAGLTAKRIGVRYQRGAAAPDGRTEIDLDSLGVSAEAGAVGVGRTGVNIRSGKVIIEGRTIRIEGLSIPEITSRSIAFKNRELSLRFPRGALIRDLQASITFELPPPLPAGQKKAANAPRFQSIQIPTLRIGEISAPSGRVDDVPLGIDIQLGKTTSLYDVRADGVALGFDDDGLASIQGSVGAGIDLAGLHAVVTRKLEIGGDIAAKRVTYNLGKRSLAVRGLSAGGDVQAPALGTGFDVRQLDVDVQLGKDEITLTNFGANSIQAKDFTLGDGTFEIKNLNAALRQVNFEKLRLGFQTVQPPGAKAPTKKIRFVAAEGVTVGRVELSSGAQPTFVAAVGTTFEDGITGALGRTQQRTIDASLAITGFIGGISIKRLRWDENLLQIDGKAAALDVAAQGPVASLKGDDLLSAFIGTRIRSTAGIRADVRISAEEARKLGAARSLSERAIEAIQAFRKANRLVAPPQPAPPELAIALGGGLPRLEAIATAVDLPGLTVGVTAGGLTVRENKAEAGQTQPGVRLGDIALRYGDILIPLKNVTAAGLALDVPLAGPARGTVIEVESLSAKSEPFNLYLTSILAGTSTASTLDDVAGYLDNALATVASRALNVSRLQAGANLTALGDSLSLAPRLDTTGYNDRTQTAVKLTEVALAAVAQVLLAQAAIAAPLALLDVLVILGLLLYFTASAARSKAVEVFRRAGLDEKAADQAVDDLLDRRTIRYTTIQAIVSKHAPGLTLPPGLHDFSLTVGIDANLQTRDLTANLSFRLADGPFDIKRDRVSGHADRVDLGVDASAQLRSLKVPASLPRLDLKKLRVTILPDR